MEASVEIASVGKLRVVRRIFLGIGPLALAGLIWRNFSFDYAGEYFIFCLMACSGFAGAFLSRGLTLDAAAGDAVCWWGLSFWGLGRLRLYSWRVKSADAHVRVAERVRIFQTSKGTSTHVEFPMVMAGQDLLIFPTLLAARQAAKKVAKTFSIPLQEESRSGIAVTQSADIGLPMRERLLKSGRSPSEPVSPKTSRLRVAVGEAGFTVELPKAPVMGAAKVSFGFAAAIVGGFLFLVLINILPLVAALFSGLAAVPLSCPFFYDLLKRETVRINSSELVVSWKVFGIFPRTRRLSSGDLESLEEIPAATGWYASQYGPSGPGLRAVGDEDLIEFGFGLRDEERRYLHDLILYAAAS